MLFLSETHAALRTLRFYLFRSCSNEGPNAPLQPSDVHVSLLKNESGRFVKCMLTFTTTPSEEAHVPLPEVYTVDPRSLGHQIRADHVEIKLRITGRRETLHDPASERSNCNQTDLEALAGQSGGLALFCKECRSPLLSHPVRTILPLAPSHWSELAENWFCGTCCSGGGEKALSLQQHMQIGLSLRPDACLIGSATCVLHSDDFLHDLRSAWEGSDITRRAEDSTNHLSDKGTSVPANGSLPEGSKGGRIPEAEEDGSLLELGNLVLQGSSASNAAEERSENLDGLGEEESLGRCDLQEGPRHSSLPANGGEGPSVCCGHQHTPVASPDLPASIEQPQLMEPSPKGLFWRPLVCPGCSTPLGAGQPQGHGVHIFKHRVATSAADSEEDLLRTSSVGSSFAARLEEESESRGCFRFAVRELQSGEAACQVVLLNKDVYIETGECLPKGECKRRGFHALKVTYEVGGLLANSTSSQASQEEEALYLPQYELEELLKCLQQNSQDFPPACRTFKSATVSYLPIRKPR